MIKLLDDLSQNSNAHNKNDVVTKRGSNTPLSDEQSHDIKRLSRLIELTDSAVITFALYSPNSRERMMDALETQLTLPVQRTLIKEYALNPLRVIGDTPVEQRTVFFFTFYGSWRSEDGDFSDLEKLTGYLNIQREGYTNYPHVAVFWFLESQLNEIIKRAPDFWAWRSGSIFDFRDDLYSDDEEVFQGKTFEEADFVKRLEIERQVDILLSKCDDIENTKELNAIKFKLAQSYRKLGRYTEALILVDDLVNDNFPNDEKKSELLDFQAGLYQNLGRYEKAEPLYRQAIDINKNMLGEKHPRYASYLNNLANLHSKMGRYEEAELLYRQAIEIIDKEHPDFATGLNNLANLYCDIGRYEEAEPLCRQAIEIDKKIVGEEHPKYAASLNTLALLLESMGRYKEAEPLYRKMIDIDKKTVGEEHPDYAIHLNNLALLLERMKRYEEAELLYRQAIKIGQKTVGVGHPDYATRLNNLALLLEKRGSYDEVKLLYIQAKEILEVKLGEEHPSTIACKRNYQEFLDS